MKGVGFRSWLRGTCVAVPLIAGLVVGVVALIGGASPSNGRGGLPGEGAGLPDQRGRELGVAAGAGAGRDPHVEKRSGPDLSGRAHRGSEVDPAAVSKAQPSLDPVAWRALWQKIISEDRRVAVEALMRLVTLHEGGAIDLALLLESLLTLEAFPKGLENMNSGVHRSLPWGDVFAEAVAQDIPRVLEVARLRASGSAHVTFALLGVAELTPAHLPAGLALLAAHRDDPRALSLLTLAYEKAGPAVLPLVLPLLDAFLDLEDARERADSDVEVFSGSLVEARSWNLRDLLIAGGEEVIPQIARALDPYKQASAPDGPWQASGDDVRGALCDALCAHRDAAAGEIVALLRDGDEKLRWHLLYRLGEAETSHPASIQRAMVDLARDAKREDSWLALSYLGNQGESVRELLLEMLVDERVLMRNGAAAALAKAGVRSHETISRLVGMLNDSDAHIYGEEALAALLTAERIDATQAERLVAVLPGLSHIFRAQVTKIATLVAPHPSALYEPLRAGNTTAFFLLAHVDAPNDLHRLICKEHVQSPSDDVRLVAQSLGGEGLAGIAAVLEEQRAGESRRSGRVVDCALLELRRYRSQPQKLLRALLATQDIVDAGLQMSSWRERHLGARILDAFGGDHGRILSWTGGEERAEQRRSLIGMAFSPLDKPGLDALREGLRHKRGEVRERSALLLIEARQSAELPESQRLDVVLLPALTDVVASTRLHAALALISFDKVRARAVRVALRELDHADVKHTHMAAAILRDAWYLQDHAESMDLRRRLVPYRQHPHERTRELVKFLLDKAGSDER